MYVSKPGEEDNGERVRECEGLSRLATERPALHEYLTLSRYPDGSERTTATLLILCERGRIKLCLGDRERGRSLWVTADSIEEGLAQIDEDLQLGTADWRKSYGQGGRGKK